MLFFFGRSLFRVCVCFFGFVVGIYFVFLFWCGFVLGLSLVGSGILTSRFFSSSCIFVGERF